MRFAIFDSEGLPLGFFSADVHGAAIPSAAVPVTDQQWVEFLENQGRRKWVNGEVVEYTPPAQPSPPRAVTPVQFIRTLRDLGKYEAGLQVLGGVESADYAELVTSHLVSEADQRVVDGLAAIGVTLDEMFGPLA